MAVATGALAALLAAWILLGPDAVLPRWTAAGASARERAARRVFLPLRRWNPAFRFDPEAFLVQAPNARSTRPWPEHPDGRIVISRDERGFRQRPPIPPGLPRTRILVCGDSHTAGLVNDDETFASVLGRRLDEERPGVAHDVIDAGVAYTGPTCYLGRIRGCLDLEPEVVVAAFFVGNDPFDELLLHTALAGDRLPSDEGYMAPLRRAGAISQGAVSQGLNLAHRFARWPGEEARSMELVVSAYRDMDRLCREHGILLVALLLPTKMDVDLADDRETMDRARRELGLDEEQAALGARLGAEFVRAMAELGIPCIDPTSAMRACDTPLYWRKDYHLNVAGHALVAELLLQELLPLLAARSGGGPLATER